MKKISKLSLIFVIILLTLFTLFIYINSKTSRVLRGLILKAQFTCPEKITKEASEAYLSKFTKFYITNYPEITFDDFLSKRMQLLVDNKCTITLQNLANQNKNGALPDQDSVNELKNIPYGEHNKKLGEGF